MSVAECHRIEGSFFILGVSVVFSPLRTCYVGDYSRASDAKFYLLFLSVVLWIVVVKLLCVLYMLCLVWGYHFFPLLDSEAVSVLRFS
jgi:hypothetical protein